MSSGYETSREEGMSILDYLEAYYEIPAIGALMAFMLWVRLRAYDNFVVDGEVYFSGNDPWYHFRETSYVVQNWPFTMPFDPWTGFPYGRLAGQFGTLWDQLVATAILIVTLGSGDPDTAARVMLIATPVAATLCAIPTYFIARRFVGKFGAVFAVLILALIPGQFLTRSTVGSFQHHAAETLFMSVAVLAFLVALGVADRHKPVWELAVDRDVEALRTPLTYSALAGVATALYMYVWQPGVLLVGIAGVFFVIKITSDVVHQDSPEPAAFVAAVSMTVAGLLMILPLEEFRFAVTGYSFTQILLPLGVAAGAVLLAFLAREWEDRDQEPSTYPPAVGALILVALGLFALVLPDAWGMIQHNLLRTVGFGAGAETRTIAEAQPLLSKGDGVTPILGEYGFTFFFALAAAVGLLATPLIRSDDPRNTYYAVASPAAVALLVGIPAIPAVVAGLFGVSWQLVALAVAALVFLGATYRVRYDTELLFLLVWAAFLVCAAFTQLRFNYYLVIPVAIATGIFVEAVMAQLDLLRHPGDVVDDVEGWQVMVALALFALILGPGLLFPLTAGGAAAYPAHQVGEHSNPGAVEYWGDTMEWMNEETPHPGELEGHDNGMEYYGTYERPADGDFEYPDGAYGVMSWWDYGHWITTQAERIPVANPFQQNARTAANYLLAPSEERGEEILADQGNEGENVRYVMVDWQMVNPQSKFVAPIIWYDEEELDRDDFFFTAWAPTERGVQPAFRVNEQRYYESLMVRLYEYHGSAKDPAPIVVDWEEETYETQDGESVTVRELPGGDEPPIRTFDSVAEAEEYVEEQDGSAQLGGIGPHPSERVEALEHYRLVKAAEQPATSTILQRAQLAMQTGLPDGFVTGHTPNWVKTFERVPGATIEGSGAEPGAEVAAEVEMEIPATGETFTYTQYAEADENGEFEFHVPYSTTGYDEFGPENGYTNVSVRATGEYEIFGPEYEEDGEIRRNGATTDVTEAQVVGEDDEPVEVELEAVTPDEDDEADEADDDADSLRDPVLDRDAITVESVRTGER